jgi:UV DNA damage endonuclease
VRPLGHVSVSRESLLPDHDPGQRPDYAALVAAGMKPRELRGHSDLMWNEAINDLVVDHLAWSDFEVEAKLKNLASKQVAQHAQRRWAARAAAEQRAGATPRA